jgi:hypothetical protein
VNKNLDEMMLLNAAFLVDKSQEPLRGVYVT